MFSHTQQISKKMIFWPVLLGFCVMGLLLPGCLPLSTSSDAVLTAQERQWLAEHADELTVVTSNWPPYEFFDSQGAYIGYVADYIDLLQKKLNIKFRVVRTKNWVEAEHLAMTHQVAMITSIVHTPERARKLMFAGPFRVIPISIITRDSVKETLTLANLSGKKVAYVEGYFTGGAIRSNYPNINLQTVPDDLDGIRLLSLGGIDAYISDVGVAVYHAERQGINNLRVAGDTGYQYVLHVGVRKDWPILARVLQKGMNAISAEENERLYHKWVSLKQGNFWQSREFWLIIVVVASIALLIVGLVVFWNWTLRRKVAQRTQELADSERKYRALYDNSISGIFQTTLQGTFISANPSFVHMFGYDWENVEEVLAGFTDLAEQAYVHAAVRQEFMAILLRDGKVMNFEAEFYCKDRSTLWVMLNALLVKDEAGTPVFIEGNCVDISDRKRAEQELMKIHNGLEQLVEERTRELSAANQELTELNEEMSTLNESMIEANHKLHQEVEHRSAIEHGLLLREKQYQATMNLVANSTTEIEDNLKAILQDALGLIKAPGGTIGLVNEKKQYVVIHAAGVVQHLTGFSTSVFQGAFGTVRETGELVHIEDYHRFHRRIADERLNRLTTMLMIPLKQQGTVIGAFSAMWEDEVGNVQPGDIDILRQYGNLASVVLEKANAQKQMTVMAFQDVLTGLPNRAKMTLQLEEELQQARQGKASGMLLFIDFDELKLINDNFGHTCGDQVIIATGNYIVSSLEESAFVARMGGDEFIVLLPEVNRREQGALIADRLVQSLHREYDVCGQQVHMSASIGATLYPEDADTVEGILQTADSAMYAAKAAGRNCWRFFESAMREEAYNKMVVTNSLRRALEREELFIQYQPQLGLKTGLVIGFEALVRWQSEEHGLVSPAKFIPLAEQSGLIQPIGEWVLRQACRFAGVLADMGAADLHVAVNISPRQLELADFVSRVKAAIEAAGISPQQLELEITESVLIDSLEASIGKLRELQAMGIWLSLDDFGTGFSSLTYLRQLPVQTLKIDKSFIDRISEDHLQKGFVASIIEMAHVLGLFVIAEGVETASQQQMLRGLACDGLQGYHFARPMDEAAVVDFLTETNILKNKERK